MLKHRPKNYEMLSVKDEKEHEPLSNMRNSAFRSTNDLGAQNQSANEGYDAKRLGSCSSKLINCSNLTRRSSYFAGVDFPKLKFTPSEGISLSNGATLVNEIKHADLEPIVVRVSNDGIFWAVGFTKGIVRIYTYLDELPRAFGTSGKALTLKARDEQHQVTDICFMPATKHCNETRILSTYASGFIRMWNYTHKDPRARHLLELREECPYTADAIDTGVPLPQYNTILCSAISYDGLRYITGGTDLIIRVYETVDMTEINRCKATNVENVMDGHKKQICALAYHPLGQENPNYSHTFLSGGWDDIVMVWDDRVKTCLYQYCGPHICGNDSLDIDPKNNTILAGSWSRDLFFIFKFNDAIVIGSSRKFSRSMKKYEKPIYQVSQKTLSLKSMTYVSQWLDSDIIILGGGNNNAVSVVNKAAMNMTACIYNLPGAVFSIAIKREKYKSKERKLKDKIKEYRLAICSGKSIFIVRLDAKHASGIAS